MLDLKALTPLWMTVPVRGDAKVEGLPHSGVAIGRLIILFGSRSSRGTFILSEEDDCLRIRKQSKCSINFELGIKDCSFVADGGQLWAFPSEQYARVWRFKPGMPDWE